ncbi:MAG: hypothetical protein JNK15_14070 [Planctomycetes bacterium]|nr:hypothetical protein [Planctomycetota bacterium]
MQLFPSLSAIACLCAAVSAQVNPFVFYPQDPERQTLTCTSYVGRPDVANAAEALMELNSEHFRGVGDANGYIRLFGIYHWLADEKLSTTEYYDLVVRKGTAANGPDMSAAAELLRIANLPSPPSTNPARGTWILYEGFNITGGLVVFDPTGVANHNDPFVGIPDRLYVGVGLPANPLWPATDGHSLFRADMLGANTPATVGENERLGAPHPTWAGKQGVPSFTTPWSYVLGPFVTSPNLHIGGVDPLSSRLGAPGANLAMNGLHPDVGGLPRRDGLIVRVTDNLAPFGVVALGGAVGFQVPYYWPWSTSTLPFGLIGYSFIGDIGPSANQANPLAAGVLVNGVKEFTLALPNTLPASMVGTDFAFQAIVWDVNNGIAEWTNAQETHL